MLTLVAVCCPDVEVDGLNPKTSKGDQNALVSLDEPFNLA